MGNYHQSIFDNILYKRKCKWFELYPNTFKWNKYRFEENVEHLSFGKKYVTLQ